MRKYLPTDELIYKDIETNSEKKVVFLSGIGLDIKKQREGFVRRYALNCGVSYLALDYTKYIMSDANPDEQISQIVPKTMEKLAQDNKKLYLYGMCYGGLIALKIAEQIPERIGGMVTFSPLCETPTFPWVEQTNQFLIKREENLKHRQTAPHIIEQMILFRQVITTILKTTGREKLMPTYKGPLHIFHGEKDRLIPAENSLHIQRALHNPNCCVHIMPMTNHAINSDFKMEMPIRMLNEFLSRN